LKCAFEKSKGNGAVYKAFTLDWETSTVLYEKSGGGLGNAWKPGLQNKGWEGAGSERRCLGSRQYKSYSKSQGNKQEASLGLAQRGRERLGQKTNCLM